MHAVGLFDATRLANFQQWRLQLRVVRQFYKLVQGSG